MGDGDAFKVLPFALTNPILVDGNGDGRFAPKKDEAGRGKRKER